MSKKTGIVIFSIVETVTNAAALILWLQQVDGGLLTSNKIAAYVVWIVGFTYEHVIALNVGRGKPLLQDPDKP